MTSKKKLSPRIIISEKGPAASASKRSPIRKPAASLATQSPIISLSFKDQAKYLFPPSSLKSVFDDQIFAPKAIQQIQSMLLNFTLRILKAVKFYCGAHHIENLCLSQSLSLLGLPDHLYTELQSTRTDKVFKFPPIFMDRLTKFLVAYDRIYIQDIDTIAELLLSVLYLIVKDIPHAKPNKGSRRQKVSLIELIDYWRTNKVMWARELLI